MEQQPQNPGQSPAVQAALARRSEAPGQLGQVSQQAPMQNPVPEMPNPSDANKSSAPATAPAQKWEPQNQQDFIISALAEQLKNSHKLEMEKTKIPQPSMGAMPVAQSQPPMTPPMSGMPAGGGNSDMFSTPKDSSANYFDMSVPSMFSPMSTSQKQNQYGM